MPSDLAELMRNADICDALGSLCDLQLEEDAREPLWCTIDGASELVSIARDGSGGRFVTVPPSPRVIHVSSEGAAGVVAASVDEFITISVVCPYWRDLLKFSGGGKLAEMRRAAPVLEACWLDDDADNEATREFLLAEIGITPPEDLAGLLFGNVATSVAIAHGEDGSALEPLFGRFTVNDNPMLKPYMD